jgi:hypothetical protein
MRAKKPLWRRIVRGFAIGLAVLVGLLALAVAFVHTPWGKELVRGQLEKQLAKSVDGSVRVGALDYGFMFGSLHVRDVEIRDREGRPAIALAVLDIALDRSSVLDGEPVLGALAVHGLRVAVTQHADGTTSLDTLFAKSGAREPLNRIVIEQLAVDGAIEVVTPTGERISIRELDVRGRLDARPVAQQLELVLAPLSARVVIAGKDVPVRIASSTVKRDRERLEVHVASLGAGPLALEELRGQLGLGPAGLTGEQNASVKALRIDHQALAKLAGKPVLAHDVAVDATLHGPLEQLVASGTLHAGTARATLTGSANLAAARPMYTASLVGEGLGTELFPQPPETPRLTGAVHLHLAGNGVTPGDAEARLELGVRALGSELTATATLARDQTVQGAVVFNATPREVLARLREANIPLPPDVEKLSARMPPEVKLAATASGRIDGGLALTLAPTTLAVAGGAVELEGQATVDAGVLRAGTAKVSLRKLDLSALAALAGKPPSARGSLTGTIAMQHDGASPRADYQLAVSLANPRIQIAAHGQLDRSSLRARARLASGTLALGTVAATLPLGERNGTLAVEPTGRWRVVVDLPRRALAELSMLVPPALRAQLPPGEVALHADIAGTPQRPSGRFTASFADGDKRGEVGGTFQTTATGTSLTTHTTLDIAHERVAVVDANLAIPSGTLDAASIKRSARVDATIDVPARSFASLATLAPDLAKLAPLDAQLGGTLGGTLRVTGSAGAPALDGTLAWRDYRTAAGALATTTVQLTGTPAQLDAKLVHADAVVVRARVDRSDPARVTVTASARANTVPLTAVVPAIVAEQLGAADPGRLDSDLEGRFVLRTAGGATTIDDVAVTGGLALAGGSLRLPGSERRYHDLGLVVNARPTGLALAARASESDLERRDRQLRAEGTLAFANHRPSELALSIVANKWLVFGGTMGTAAGPQATIDADVQIAAYFATPVPTVDATIRSLTFDAPDRGDLPLQHKLVFDDVIFVEPGAHAGVFPVAPAPVATPSANRPMKIAVHIPSPIKVIQGPLEMQPRGDLVVDVRPDGVTTDGTLAIERGAMSFFGNRFDLASGRIELSKQHPAGHMAMVFERQLPDATVRGISRTTGNKARISIAGPFSDVKVAFSGATNVEFTDVVAVNNVGHARTVTHPGLPVSSTAQVPRGVPLLMTAFFAMLAPKLLFLDRIAAWSDPADGRHDKIQRVEAERALAGERYRVRGVMRPMVPGRSGAELQLDRVLIHDDRKAAGIGVRAGDRGGGGVGVFFEWSSDD